jgi:hypothetical protein
LLSFYAGALKSRSSPAQRVHCGKFRSAIEFPFLQRKAIIRPSLWNLRQNDALVASVQKHPFVGACAFFRRIRMDKKIAGLLGAVAAVSTMGGAQAASVDPAAALRATSYADLLNPVPNAVELQIADDNARLAKSSGDEVQMAQIQVQIGHHHHHHRYHRRVIVVPPRRHRHHHHHHSHYMAVPKAIV